MTAPTWEEYAGTHLHNEDAYLGEPVQQARALALACRVHGTVLDVGGGDGYVANLMRAEGCDVTVFDISDIRVRRARAAGFTAHQGDACALPYPDGEFDCVVLGEVLEHLDNPGPAFSEAFRVARDRVVMSVPLGGWEDPTHQWRISLDDCVDDGETNVTKGRQLVLAWQRGRCWPHGYHAFDPSWKRQFQEGR